MAKEIDEITKRINKADKQMKDFKECIELLSYYAFEFIESMINEELKQVLENIKEESNKSLENAIHKYLESLSDTEIEKVWCKMANTFGLEPSPLSPTLKKDIKDNLEKLIFNYGAFLYVFVWKRIFDD